jgi:DNA-binding NtrC family response regulator
VTRVVTRAGCDVRVLKTCQLEVLNGPDAGRQARMARAVYRIGTHASNDLVLRDETVSRHHVEVAIAPDGYRLTDLDSSNGTFVGSTRIRELTVLEPTNLQVGRTRLRLEPTSDEIEVAASPRRHFGAVMGRSVVMRELFEQLEAAARSDCSVVLEGETGVGKELIAESLHRESARRHGPFVVVDCCALPAELLEAELFGWARGAFSGADEDRRGLIERANGGTLFFDEIADLPRALQTKLLGALDRRRIRPLGGTVRPIDVRVVVATRTNLAREVNQGRLRADLFFRLAVLRLTVPPLRERTDDIPLLAEHFLASLSSPDGEAPPELSAVVLARLQSRPWPGNVRELRNAVEGAVLKVVRETHEHARAPAAAPERPSALFAAREQALEEFERRYFDDLLLRAGSNLSRASRLASMDRRYLHRVLHRLGLLPAAS